MRTFPLLSALCLSVLFIVQWQAPAAKACQRISAPPASQQQTRRDEEVFSGPQAGEPLPLLEARLALGENAGKQVALVQEEQQQPTLLIFVHNVTRPSIGLTRTLSGWAATKKPDGLKTAVVFLTADPTEGEAQIKRMQHALTKDVPTAISPEGAEGPGSYGLNRNVTLTILVADKGLISANHALVQPSLQADLPKILKDIVGVIGGEMPRLETLPGMARMAASPGNGGGAPDMRSLLAPVIQKTATEEEVIRAAQRVERAANGNTAVQAELHRITNTIINAGKLQNYGTPKAQEYLKKWSTQYAEDSPAKQQRPGRSPNGKKDSRP